MAVRATQATRSTQVPVEALAHPIIGRGVWRPQLGLQNAYVDCPCPEVFLGGTRGSGKTDGVLGKWAIKERRYGPAFNAVGFRPTAVSFKDAIERSAEIYGPLGANFTKNPPEWRMPHGGRVAFAYLENEKDAEQYQGRNVTDAWVEEAGQYPRPAPIDRLFGVLRSAHGVPIQLTLTANPGGAGQLWLRDRYQLVPFPLKPRLLIRTLPDGTRHHVAVIPGRLMQDNKILTTSDPGYVSRLHLVGSAQLVKAWLEGDWTAIEGAFFDCWSEKQHVIPPFVVPDDWLRFRSGDWGSASPFSFGWWAVVQDDFALPADVDYATALRQRFALDAADVAGSRMADHKAPPAARILPRGALVRYREDYGASGPGKGLKLAAEQVGARIVKNEKPDPRLAYAVLDPSAFKEDGGPSIAERVNKVLLDNKPPLAPFREADNSRVSRVQGRDRGGPMGGWDAVRGRLIGSAKIDENGLIDWSTGRPMIYCFSTCKDSIRTIPTLQHDPARAEDLDTNSEDHCFVGETMVATLAGPCRIDSLPEIGQLWDADGLLRPYRTPRLTRRQTRVIRLEFDDGSVVTCTPDHRFFCGDQWVAAGNMLDKTPVSYRIPAWTNLSLSVRQSKSFGGCATISAALTIRPKVSAFIASSGKRLTAAFRAALTFTTTTLISITIGPAISFVSNRLHTWPFMGDCVLANPPSRSQYTRDLPLPTGTDQKKAASGTKSTGNDIANRLWNAASIISVSTAANRLSGRQSLLGFVRTLVSPLIDERRKLTTSNENVSSAASHFGSIASQRRQRVGESAVLLCSRKSRPACRAISEAGRADVYCLTVPDAGSFVLANGIAVANCADDWRYGVLSRPWLKTPIVPEEPADGYKPVEDAQRLQEGFKLL
jgi:hypothetical protein